MSKLTCIFKLSIAWITFHVLRVLQKSSFELYRHYGENNEQAQKLLYELEADDAMKAFLIVSLTLWLQK